MEQHEPSAALLLEGTQGRLGLRVRSREAADPTHPYWDGNWLATIVEVRTRSFSVRLNASLKTHEFADFLLEVRRLAAGEAGVARFRSIEGWLSLDLTADRDGTVSVSGVAREPSDPANELRFAVLDVRDPDVTGIGNAVEGVLERFPVVGRRDE